MLQSIKFGSINFSNPCHKHRNWNHAKFDDLNAGREYYLLYLWQNLICKRIQFSLDKEKIWNLINKNSINIVNSTHLVSSIINNIV